METVGRKGIDPAEVTRRPGINKQVRHGEPVNLAREGTGNDRRIEMADVVRSQKKWALHLHVLRMQHAHASDHAEERLQDSASNGITEPTHTTFVMIQSAKEKLRVGGPPAFNVTLFLRVLLIVLNTLVIITAAARIGPAEISEVFVGKMMQDTFNLFRRWLDLAWIFTAFFAAYWCCVIEDGLAKARHVCLIALALVVALLIATRMNFFGATAHYTDELGARIPGGVSVGTILLWTTLLVAVRSTIYRIGRLRFSRLLACLIGGVCMLIASYPIEHWMAQPRGWWFWADPADSRKAVENYLWAPFIWTGAAMLFLGITPRAFSAKETESGWIILTCLALAGLLA